MGVEESKSMTDLVLGLIIVCVVIALVAVMTGLLICALTNFRVNRFCLACYTEKVWQKDGYRINE